MAIKQHKRKESIMDKLPECYGQAVDPYCPACVSGEYPHNEDRNGNNFCGQCGCPLDWSQMYNEDMDQVEERFKCGDWAEDCRTEEKETQGVCKARGGLFMQSKPACKQHFR